MKESNLWGDDPEEYNPGATLLKGSILEPNLISSGEDSNNSDLEITKVWKIIIIIYTIMLWSSKSSFRAQLQIITIRIYFSESKIKVAIISIRKHEREGFWQLE